MRRPKKEIQLTSYDELLGLEESPEKSMNQVVEIELEKLYPFKNHPFHVNSDIYGGSRKCKKFTTGFSDKRCRIPICGLWLWNLSDVSVYRKIR